jgi:hypothetical protein
MVNVINNLTKQQDAQAYQYSRCSGSDDGVFPLLRHAFSLVQVHLQGVNKS